MLTVSVILSVVMLALVGGTARVARRMFAPVLFTAALFVLCPILFGLFFTAVALQAGLLVLIATLCQVARWPARRFVGLSCAATLAANALVGGFAYQDAARLSENLEQNHHLFVSMDERLPPPREISAHALPSATLQHLDSLEESIDNSESVWHEQMRLEKLEEFHARIVKAFVKRPGAGVSRMFTTVGESLGGFPQPGTRIAFTGSTGELEAPAGALPKEDFEPSWRLHSAGILNFADFPQERLFQGPPTRCRLQGALAQRRAPTG